MTSLAVAVLAAAAALPARGETENFDGTRLTALPNGWGCGVTGKGNPRWAVNIDLSAPSRPHVLQQSGVATFSWCVKEDVSLTDGFVEVKLMPLLGNEDQAGGVVWRWKDAHNYYVARANALEKNVSLYYTANGKRYTVKYVNAPVVAKVWHMLRVEFAGKRIKVALNGKTYIELEDEQIRDAGAVGVWTKADSVTSFDDFKFGE